MALHCLNSNALLKICHLNQTNSCSSLSHDNYNKSSDGSPSTSLSSSTTKNQSDNLVMCIHNVAICTSLEKRSTDHEGTEEELYLSAIT